MLAYLANSTSLDKQWVLILPLLVAIAIVFLQEIYLEKNGTSQLGVTLGYDTKYSRGQLYVCEVSIVYYCYFNHAHCIVPGQIMLTLTIILCYSS